MREPITADRFRHAPPTRFSHRAPRECPLKRCLGPKRVTLRDGTPSQNRFETARPFEANTAFTRGTKTMRVKETRKTPPQRGAGSAFVPERPLGGAARPAQMPTGLPRGARCGLLSRLRGRPPARHRRGPSLSINPRATTPMVRRWAAGTPMRHSGPEGRR